MIRSPFRRKRIKPRRSSRVRDADFMAAVRAMPCCASMLDRQPNGLTRCEGPIHAHHAGDRGLGQKASDDTCIPLCAGHHQALHDASGPFKTWTPAMRRHFAESQIANTRAAVMRRMEMRL